MNRIIILFFGFALFFGLDNVAFSQCDCPGNVPPPMIIISGPINNGRLMPIEGDAYINATYRYSQGKKLYSADSKQDNIFQREYYHNFIGLSANYAVLSTFSLGIESGFFMARVTDVYEAKNYSKLSHISINSRYNIFDRNHDDEFILNAGIKFPLNNDALDTTGLAKPASSAFGFLFGTTYNLMINSQMNLFLNANYDLNLSNSDGTKIGDAIYTQLLCRYNNINNFSPALALAFDYRMKDKFNYAKVQNSAGYSLNIIPSISYMVEGWASSINLSFMLPVYRYLLGYQSGQDFAVQISISLAK